MATLISNASGNLTGATTFAAVEAGALALNLIRNQGNGLGAATSTTSSSFTVTNAAVIDGVLLFVQQAGTSTGTFKVDLQKGGVSQASVTVNKADLPASTSSSLGSYPPVFFKFTGTATGDGGSNWTIVLTTTGTGNVNWMSASATAALFSKALRTTTAVTAVAADNLFIVGELTGAGTKNDIIVTMDSTVATAYGSGAVNSTSVYGGGIHISNWGTLTYGAAGYVSSDPYWSSVKLLLGFEGADASTTITDESSSARGNATVMDQAQIDTAQYKFGTSSLYLPAAADGFGDYITYPDSADWDLGTGQFTLEGWFRFGSLAYYTSLISQFYPGGWVWLFQDGKLRFYGDGPDVVEYTWAPTNNQWYFLAVDRDASNVCRLYVDGAMVAKTTAFTQSLSGASKLLSIGSLRDSGLNGYDLKGHVDDIRITKGVARYASDSGHAVPTAAFPRTIFTGVPAPGTNYILRVNGDVIVYQNGTLNIGSSAADSTWRVTDIVGLKGWWDASTTSSLSLTGSTVDRVGDLSGSSNPMFGFPGAKPTYSATGFNSKPAFLFSSQTFENNAFPLGTGNTLTIWFVGQFSNSTATYGRALSYYAGGTNDADNNTSWLVARDNTTSGIVYYRNANTAGRAFGFDTPHRCIVTVKSDGTHTMYVDGVGTSSTFLAGTAFGSLGTLRIGNVATGSPSFWAGAIAECGVATGYSDATTVGLLDTYLKNKWGL